jgi:hypothetical protein
VIGTVTLSVVVHRDDVAAAVSTIMLDRGRLEIDSVLTVSYHGTPSSGLVFDTEREQIYTVFSTSQ